MTKLAATTALLLALAGGSALAALNTGAKAPDFSVQATQGGDEFTFKLSDALKKGPVVLYFYPAAFTKTCTQEAHDFAEATDKFHALGATVIGVSQDKIGKLKDFATSECRKKFPVAADKDGSVSKAYDAVLVGFLGYSDRVSYVIAPNGEIAYSYRAMGSEGHVANTMAVVERLKGPGKAP